MKKYIYIILIPLFLLSCEYTPIYSNKNDYNFSIEKINFEGNSEINNFFRHNIKKDSIEVKRLTRILYKKKLFLYPLSPFNTLFKLGIIEAIQMLTSYLYVKIFSIYFRFKINNFEDWVINNFGRKFDA